MAEIFTFKGIKPKKLKVEAIRKEIMRELQKEGKEQQKQLKKTTATWQGDKPKFETIVDIDAEGAGVLTGPSGNTKGIKKWNWLDQGTRVRRALMSRNWKSKTRPGHFGSGAGRGRVVFISKRVNRPGIKPRNWSALLTKRRRKPFTNRMIKALRRGAQRAF
jgi:hypothetical protein